MRPPNALSYRPDIDGLRALAVLSVVAFHIQFGRSPGGYVGVDIFFVISGYLITSILARDIVNGGFSLSGFYERRCRRILPPLFVVLAGAVVLAYIYLLPVDFTDFAKSLFASVFSFSNLYFWTKEGYFSAQGPLLHTWSLAVEEQFYLVFPLFLAGIYRYKREWLSRAVVLVAIVSFALSVYTQLHWPTANFYLPAQRAWELLSGSIVALRVFPHPQSRISRELCATFGAALMIAPIMIYTAATPFPGLSALPPCLGAALVIVAGEAGHKPWFNSLLSLRPVVFIGTISYSLYLVHWPLIIFGEFGFLRFVSFAHRWNVAIYLMASLLLAYLLYRFIEVPFRAKVVLGSRRGIFVASAAGLAVFATVSLSVVLSNGFMSRYPPEALRLAHWYRAPGEYANFRQGSCFVVFPESYKEFSPETCLHLDPQHKNIILLGDSHAAAIWHGLSLALAPTNVLQATASNCKPFPNQGANTDCGELMSYVFNEFFSKNKVDAIVVTARWKDADRNGLTQLAQWAHQRGTKLIVLGPVMEYDAPLPVLLAYGVRQHDVNLPYRHRITAMADLDEQMKADAANIWHVPYLSLVDATCASTSCVDLVNGEEGKPGQRIPILFDQDHYTDSGSIFVLNQLSRRGGLSEVTQ